MNHLKPIYTGKAEARQDPSEPVELDLQSSIGRRPTGLLEAKYLKETSVRFV